MKERGQVFVNLVYSHLPGNKKGRKHYCQAIKKPGNKKTGNIIARQHCQEKGRQQKSQATKKAGNIHAGQQQRKTAW